MSHQSRETELKIDVEQPTIDDFRKIAAERGANPSADIDPESFTYPVSDRTWSDVTESDATPPRPPSQMSDSRELERLGDEVRNIFRQSFGEINRQVRLSNIVQLHYDAQSLVIGDLSSAPIGGELATVDLYELAQQPDTPVAPVAFTGTNCLVYDPQFDLGSSLSAAGTIHPAIPIPFDVFSEFDITREKISVVDVEQHPSGAGVVFHDEDNYYFRGGETRDGWVGQLDMAVETVEEAKREALRPDAVIAAEQQGRDVKRQGDWFFVETDDAPTGIVRHPEVETDGEDTQLGNHIADWQGIKIDNPPRVFVKGAIEHLTDDHDELYLRDWYEAINNGIDAYSYSTSLFEPQQFLESTQLAERTLRRTDGVQVRLGTEANARSSSSTTLRYD